jgi:hypothetical protein
MAYKSKKSNLGNKWMKLKVRKDEIWENNTFNDMYGLQILKIKKDIGWNKTKFFS